MTPGMVSNAAWMLPEISPVITSPVVRNGTVGTFDPGHRHELQRRKVLRGADRDRAEVELVRIVLGRLDHVLHGLERAVLVDEQHEVERRHRTDRREIPRPVVGQRLEHRRRDGVLAAHPEHRCGRRARRARRERRVRPARARHVLDHDRLADRLRHHLADGAAGDIAKPAGAKAHDDPHRPRRKLLRRARAAARPSREQHTPQAKTEPRSIITIVLLDLVFDGQRLIGANGAGDISLLSCLIR